MRISAFSPDGVIQKNQKNQNIVVSYQHPASVFDDNRVIGLIVLY
ncbi:hypothetical protein L585_15495 [Pantoea ananatis BRT175]|nr:hypothetical protein L585_15495 [Pantoea ananatis BRT175]CRH30792.1 Uncharacterized protein {ECO:0000313/EMBL:ERM13337.1} [Pantoea ananatis]